MSDRLETRAKHFELEPLLCAVVLAKQTGANSLSKIEALIEEAKS